ncbi:phage holin family protein [Chitinimonas viridis]|uniref:Phage holin family protein n=1 Tax=Chitinimonas viridis TaxID=664880 RepID=A0ABT8AZR3_9NEIS|nr:phage holin family protein [Chitinimonas viridis]MDN3575477.1 phage holin family protein [Chitinimonas viridis]
MSDLVDTPTTTRPVAGLLAGLAGLARNSLGLLLTRLELAALELSEARNQLFKLTMVCALALMSGWFAIAYSTMLIVYLTWAQLSWVILAVMASVFGCLTVALLLYARNMLRQGKLSLPATMVELRADRETLL